MPPQPILDLSSIDTTHLEADQDAIRRFNPQRYEMEQLNGICHIDRDNLIIVGYKDVREDEFWTRGHIPGRPLMPGVLMIEAAAQLASFFTHACFPEHKDRFIGFGGVDEVKFRDQIVPPCRLILMGKGVSARPRRVVCYVQGFVDRTMVFEAKVTGMPL